MHLDGSVRVETLIELSQKENLPLPSYTPEGLNKLVFKDQYQDLTEYLQGFALVLPVMQNPENLERISYEFAKDSIEDGVCYVEVRFAPQLHINNKQNIDEVLLSVNRGFKKAKEEYQGKPGFHYGIICCAMRFFTKGFSEYLDKFIDKHQDLDQNVIFGLSSLDLAKKCVATRDKHDIPIVAIDIAGAEAGNPPIIHKEAYQFAHKNLMHLTAHAGEEYGPEGIHQTITELYPERIGHGFHLFSKEEIKDESIQNKGKYLEKLIQYIAKTQTTLEACLTSNLQTMPFLKNIKDHAFAKMLDHNLSIAICTDNRTVSKTNLTKELTLAAENFDLDKAALKKLIINSFEKSFFYGSYAEKISYIKQVIETYDQLVTTQQ